MKALLCAALVAMAIGTIGLSSASAAPASGAPLANAAGTLDGIQQVWYDRYGRWHPNRPRAYYVPRPFIPRCRTVRVCSYRGCYWTRRCY
jgi:hypothetical protein